MNITINNPNPEEAGELTKVLIASKKHWGYPDEWFDLWKDDLPITPESILSRNFYVGRSENDIVFVYSIKHLSENRYELEDCWIAPQYIGKGYGKILFKNLKKNLKSINCTSLRICADPNAEGFYRKMGAVKIGEEPSKIKGRMFPIFEYTI
ncbi:MAG TPA: GNAT family N-acetyltransferase [Victivallales bacterium]|nr:GNAT family N-acetyltransferase [Victivallales bacterium]